LFIFSNRALPERKLRWASERGSVLKEERRTGANL